MNIITTFWGYYADKWDNDADKCYNKNLYKMLEVLEGKTTNYVLKYSGECPRTGFTKAAGPETNTALESMYIV